MNNVLKQDLLETTCGIIVHQVNCRGVMGAGIALAIRNKWPQVYFQYKAFCAHDSGPSWLLGCVQIVPITDKLQVANLFGQNRYGRDKRYTDYEAIKQGWNKLQNISIAEGLTPYAPWKIGCRLGGGDWSKVRSIVEENCPNVIWCRKPT